MIEKKWWDWGKQDQQKQLEQMQKIYAEMKEDWVTPESKVKGKVKQVLANVNAYYIMTNTGGYGASGAPDFICCIRGKFIGIECKAGKNETSLLQEKNLAKIMKSGGVSMIVDESTDMTEFQLKLIYIMENG